MSASITVESWIWYGFVILMVILRFTARLLHFKSVLRLQVEDWLMLFITCLYTILIVFLNIDATVQTNLINPADIPHLTATDIAQRTWGSKTVLLVEQCMCAVQWGTKACLLILYWRLTQNLAQNLVVKCVAAYVLITYVVMEILYFGVWCRPFHDYWQTPTSNTQCSTALHHLIVNLSFNLSSDLMIMSIPLPLLLKARMDLKRKLLLIFPFSLGLFTILCAILSKHLSFTQPFSGEWVFWYCRESSTAMIVTNMPYTWTLIRRVFHFKSFLGDSDTPEGTTVQGISVREASVGTADARRGSRRSSRLFLGRRSEKDKDSFSMPPTKEALDMRMTSWNRDQEVDDTDKVKTTADSIGSSASGSVTKPPTCYTAATLDKLYPLDDDELDLIEAKERKRNAHGRAYDVGE